MQVELAETVPNWHRSSPDDAGHACHHPFERGFAVDDYLAGSPFTQLGEKTHCH